MRGRNFVVGAAALVASLSALVIGPVSAGAAAGGSSSQSLCIGHHPMEYVWYTASCTGPH
jgi:hypothetical protein